MNGRGIAGLALMWNRAALQRLVTGQLGHRRLIVVCNQARLAEPLAPLLSFSDGICVSRMCLHSGCDERRVFLDETLAAGFDSAVSAGLWPLCHAVFQRPRFERRHWNALRTASQVFAEAVWKAAAGDPALVLIQDCSLALVPAILKVWNPHLALAQFWQIPWPHRETFRVFPWKRELLDSMLSSDLLAFQQQYDCRNFVDAVDSGVEARVDFEQGSVSRGGKTTLVRPAPLSIDFDQHSATAAGAQVEREMECWRRRLGAPPLLGVSVDSPGNPAGIPEGLRAIDLLLERHPEYRGQLTFLQVLLPARVASMDNGTDNEIGSAVARINARWGNQRWRPILLFRGDCSRTRLMALERLADFFLVTSLHEGMSLAAKEFVASRCDGDGVLILSQFAGAPAELQSAILVNPFAENQVAQAIHSALTLPPDQRRRRMQRLRAALAENNAYRWVGRVISSMLKLEWLDPVSPRLHPIEWPEMGAAAARAVSSAEIAV